MCDCVGNLTTTRTTGRTKTVPQEPATLQMVSLPARYELRPFITYAKKYCVNPRRHEFGTLPCCHGLKWLGTVDPRDLLTPQTNSAIRR